MRNWIIIALAVLIVVILVVVRTGTPKRATAFPPALAAGGSHTCRIAAPSLVECWGANFLGQLGKGSTGTAVAVAGPTVGLGFNALAIAGGSNHTCAVLTGGAVKCWGANAQGQLGNNSTTASPTPVTVSSLTNATDVATGNAHSCAVLSTGGVQCWGDNQFGQLGNGTNASSTSAVTVSNLTDAKAISAGMGQVCALRNSGAISCWGSGSLGSLLPAGVSSSNVPLAVPGITGATVVVAGLTHACAVLSTGAVSCWGSNSVGELGDVVFSSHPTPFPVSGVAGATAIAVGGGHSCAVVAQGEVFCWGSNANGQLGFLSAATATCNGNSGPACTATPTKVAGITGAIDVAAGDSHTCVLFPGARVACWGWNGFGQLGNGEAAAQSGVAESWSVARPVFVTRKALSISGGFGSGHSCATLPDGTARCWGSNLNGQLGNGTIGTGVNPGSGTPVQVTGLTNIVQVSAGGSHTCALLASVAMRCWGKTTFGQVGLPTGSPDQATPLPIGLGSVVGVGTGRHLSCAIQSGIAAGGISPLRCWGVNNNQQLGAPMTQPICSGTNIAVPLACTHIPVLAGVNNVVSVRGGIEHTCALRTDGAVWCWGQSSLGQLGANLTKNPMKVLGVSPAVQLAVGANHNCALIADGTVQCWGDNRQGEVGITASTNPVTVPQTVAGISDARGVIAGGDFSCALLGDGTVKCWGDNRLGLLGNPTAGNGSFTPVTVTGLSDVTHIAAAGSAFNACAVIESGAVMCWGANAAGELGRGTIGGTFGTAAAVVGLP